VNRNDVEVEARSAFGFRRMEALRQHGAARSRKNQREGLVIEAGERRMILDVDLRQSQHMGLADEAELAAEMGLEILVRQRRAHHRLPAVMRPVILAQPTGRKERR